MSYSDDDLYKMHLKGEITDDEYLAGIESNCRHAGKVEEHGSKWIEWCDKCGMKMDEGYYSESSSGKVKVSTKSGCPLAALLIIAAASASLYSVIDLVTT